LVRLESIQRLWRLHDCISCVGTHIQLQQQPLMKKGDENKFACIYLHKYVHFTETRTTWWYAVICAWMENHRFLSVNGNTYAHISMHTHANTHTHTQAHTSAHLHTCADECKPLRREHFDTFMQWHFSFSLNLCKRSFHILSAVLYSRAQVFFYLALSCLYAIKPACMHAHE